jgi:hypothetical protein
MQEAGFTRDVSTGGLYVSCVKCPPMNSTLSLQIVLPADGQVLPGSLSLESTVQVVRFGSGGEASGFAAVGELALKRSRHQGQRGALA